MKTEIIPGEDYTMVRAIKDEGKAGGFYTSPNTKSYTKGSVISKSGQGSLVFYPKDVGILFEEEGPDIFLIPKKEIIARQIDA